MSVGAVPIIDDEEDSRPLPAATVPPVAPEDIKVTPGAPSPAPPNDAAPPLAPDVSKAIDDAVAASDTPTSSPADLSSLAAPAATNPLAATPSAAAPLSQMLPNGTIHIKREVPGTPPQGELDAIEQGRQRDLASLQEQKNALNDNHVEMQAQLQKDIDDKAKAAEEKARRQEELQKTVDAKVAEQQKAFDDYKATPFRDLYAERSVGDRIFGALAVFLGGAGGRHNDALDILNAGMQHAYDKQAADIAGKWKVYEKATGDVAGAKTGMHQAMLDLDTLQAARWEVNAAELAKMKEKQGMTAEQAKLAVQETGINDRADQAKQKIVDGARYLVDESNLSPDRGKKHGGGGGGSGGALAKLHEFARANPGPENEAKVVALAEQLFPGMKPTQLQPLVAGAVKASADAKAASAGTALRRERVAANIHEFNVKAGEIDPKVITPDVLKKVQDNEKELESGEHAGLFASKIGRGLGLIARSRYDGLTPEQTKGMQALDAALQHGAEMQPTTGAEVSHQWKETYRPKPGSSQEDINRSIATIKDMGKAFKAIIDPNDIGGRADVPPLRVSRSPEEKKAAALAIWNDKKKLGTMTPTEQSRIALLAGVVK